MSTVRAGAALPDAFLCMHLSVYFLGQRLYTYLCDCCPAIFSCNMDATECSERTAQETREDGQQSKTSVMQGKGCISLEVAPQLSFYFSCCCCCSGEMYESEISSIVHTVGRTEIESDSFLQPDVVFMLVFSHG